MTQIRLCIYIVCRWRERGKVQDLFWLALSEPYNQNMGLWLRFSESRPATEQTQKKSLSIDFLLMIGEIP